MTRINFIEEAGTAHRVEAKDGSTVMQAALDQSVPGILGECGGTCSCATCHGYVDVQFLGRIPPPSDNERGLLEGVLDVRSNSRLTCQITVSPELDDMVIRLPATRAI